LVNPFLQCYWLCLGQVFGEASGKVALGQHGEPAAFSPVGQPCGFVSALGHVLALSHDDLPGRQPFESLEQPAGFASVPAIILA
jgi:hypothetical protein